jgi:hypothetical protein
MAMSASMAEPFPRRKLRNGNPMRRPMLTTCVLVGVRARGVRRPTGHVVSVTVALVDGVDARR